MMNSFSIVCRLIILLFLKNPYQALKSAWILRDGTQLTVRQLLTKDLSAKWFGPKMMELLISQTTNILKTFWLLQQRAQSARSSKKIKLHSQQRGLLHFSESLNLHITTLCKNAIKRNEVDHLTFLDKPCPLSTISKRPFINHVCKFL